jgi:hypothetical protein
MFLQINQFIDDMLGQLVCVFRCQVRQATMLAPTPHQFIWIDFWSIGWQILRHNLRVGRQESFDQLGPAVDAAAVPQHRQRAAELPFELSQKVYDIFSVDVVWQKAELQIQASGFGADRDAANGRQAITPVPAVEHGFATPLRPGTPNRRRQHEAGFIEKNQVRIAFLGGFGNLRETHLLPGFNLGFVALPRLTPWFLGRPVQASAKKAAHMIVMKRNTEVALNELNYATASPQLVRPTMCLRSLQKKVFQSLMLFGGQTRCRPCMGYGGQAVRLLSQFKPTIDGTAVNAKHARHNLRTFPVKHSFYGLTPPPFQLRSSSKWSTHIELESQNHKTIHWPRSWQ